MGMISKNIFDNKSLPSGSGKGEVIDFRSSLLVVLVIFIYRILLDTAYYYAVSPLFAYAGMIRDVDMLKLAESYYVMFIVILLMPKSENRLSDLVVQIFIITAYIPFLTLYSMANMERTWFYTTTLFWILVIYLNKVKIVIIVDAIRGGKYIYKIIAVLLVLFSLILIYFYAGISFNFNLLKVYEIRREYVALEIPAGGYLINWTAKIIIPFAILHCIYRRVKQRHVVIVALVAVGFLLFSVTGHKSYLLIIPATLCLSWIVGKARLIIIVPVVLSSVVSVSMLWFYAWADIGMLSVLTRRLLFVPAQLSFYYYDFFKEQPIYLSHSILKYFIHYPFPLPPPYMIGQMYLKSDVTDANNGLIADGFMNFGYFGIILWAIVFVMLVQTADTLVKSKNIKVLYPIMILTFYAMVNSALFTTILTHGLFVVFIVAFLYEKESTYDSL